MLIGFQGRRNREIGKLKQGQSMWTICSQFVTNKPLIFPSQHTEQMVQKTYLMRECRKGGGKRGKKKRTVLLPKKRSQQSNACQDKVARCFS